MKWQYSEGETASPSSYATGEEPFSKLDREFYITLGKHCTFVKTEVFQSKSNKYTNTAEKLHCLLTHETPSESSTCKTLTQLFDRGWLSDIKHSVVGLLQLLEVKFI